MVDGKYESGENGIAERYVFKKGKKYYLVMGGWHSTIYAGGGSFQEILDSNKKGTGYAEAAGGY